MRMVTRDKLLLPSLQLGSFSEILRLRVWNCAEATNTMRYSLHRAKERCSLCGTLHGFSTLYVTGSFAFVKGLARTKACGRDNWE